MFVVGGTWGEASARLLGGYAMSVKSMCELQGNVLVSHQYSSYVHGAGRN